MLRTILGSAAIGFGGLIYAMLVLVMVLGTASATGTGMAVAYLVFFFIPFIGLPLVLIGTLCLLIDRTSRSTIVVVEAAIVVATGLLIWRALTD